MKSIQTIITVFTFLIVANSNTSFAHCQVPCGIYEDSLRIKLIEEHITTIEKSMNQITALSAEKNINYNQLVRWVNNKELHATKIQEIVSTYFLHQRIKVTEKGDAHYEAYLTNLRLLHELSVYAMKSKQTTDLNHVGKMREVLSQFTHNYFHGHYHD